jgi:two-component system, chemotaxis family, chemotaxis protein CheY
MKVYYGLPVLEEVRGGTHSVEILESKYDSNLDESIDPDLKRTERGKQKILAVDDYECMRMLYEHILKDKFEIITAYDGQDGWDKYLEHRPQLTITDYNMPRMNGESLIKNIISSNPNAKVIMSTSNIEENFVSDMISKGVDGFLGKPFTTDELRNLVDKVMSE